MSSSRERWRAALAGERADRPPVAFWRHFPVDDQDPDNLARSSVDFQRRLQLDLIKVTPASSFCIRDWGARDEWRGDPEGTRAYTGRVIAEPRDWRSLKPLAADRGELGRTWQALARVRSLAEPDIPVLATVFSPLAQAKNLAGSTTLLEHLRSHPQEVLAGLEAIVHSTLEFVERLSAAGVDGIFYAIQHASYQYLDEDAYARFGESFDRRVLEAAAALAFNMLHLHGEALIFDLARRLRGPVVNWHSLETGPSLAEGRRRLGSAVCGGLRRRETLALGDPVMVRQEARRSLRSVGGRGVVLGAGCVVPIITPLANLEAAVEAAHDFR